MNNIEISVEKYKRTLWNYLEELVEQDETKREKIFNLSFDPKEISTILTEINYPNKDYIVNNLDKITSKDIDNLYSWYLSLPIEDKHFELRGKLKRVIDILTNLYYKNRHNVII
jgi:hypothetical protein